VGRNFGAGMSGGVAYIYDADSEAQPFLNMDMILVEHIEDADEDILLSQIREHFKSTGSTVALELLQTWQEAKNKFIKIMPIEYKKVLAAMKAKTSAVAV